MVFGGQGLEFSASIITQQYLCVPSELNEALLKREKSSLASGWFGTSRNILAWEFTCFCGSGCGWILGWVMSYDI